VWRRWRRRWSGEQARAAEAETEAVEVEAAAERLQMEEDLSALALGE
jgi:hypothetical protein